MEESEKNQFRRPHLDERQIDELIGIAKGILADGYLDDREVAFLQKWLGSNKHITNNALIDTLYLRITEVLADGVIDTEERADLVSNLSALCREDFEIGEALKATSLPLCEPPPSIVFEKMRFCFTGTFVFGSRSNCRQATADRGGVEGSLTQQTNYLVVGEYATDSWKHSSYGRKIEKAVEFRDRKNIPISIVSEKIWREAL